MSTYRDKQVDDILQICAAVQHVLMHALAHRRKGECVILNNHTAQALQLVRPDALVAVRV